MSRLSRPPITPTTVLLLLIAAAVFAPFLSTQDPSAQNLLRRFTEPAWLSGEWDNLFGTDHVGRDLFSNILYGLRVSLLVGFLAVGISVLLGAPFGLLSGYFGGRFETIVMRLVDIQLALPTILIALGVLAILGPGLWKVILVIGIVGWAEYARLTRAAVLAEREKDYVSGARALGSSSGRIVFRHILPNVVSVVLVQISVHMPQAIILEATLSFLGLGVGTGTPSLGLMVSRGYEFLYSGVWWVSILPGLALMLLILSVNLLGDWLRDALDPSQQGSGVSR